MKITIFYGTETGNSQFLAEDMADTLSAEHETSAINMDDGSIELLLQSELLLIFTSTYGDGELPASAKSFHSALNNKKPDLSGVKYAVFGLGDMTYAETFGKGAELLDTLLATLGASRVAQREVHDAKSRDTADSHVQRWLNSFLPVIAETV